MDFEAIKDRVRKCCEERDWDQFHDPKSLACDIVIEASEVLEHFRFLSAERSRELMQTGPERQKVEAELADILFGLARFCQLYNIDLGKAVNTKISEIQAKYPIGKSKGSPKKYDQL